MVDILIGFIGLIIFSWMGIRFFKIRNEKFDHPSQNISKTQGLFFSIFGIIASLLLIARGFGIE